MEPTTLLLLGGGAAVATLAWFLRGLFLNDPLTRRLKAIERRRTELRSTLAARPSRRANLKKQTFIKQVVQTLKLARGGATDDARKKLVQAGFRSREAVTSFMFAKLAVPAVLFFNLFILLFMLEVGHLKPVQALVTTVFASLIGFFLPDVWLKNAIQKREEILRKQFPDALDLMVICAEAGLSLDASFERVAREMAVSSPELAEEIGLTGVELGFLPDRQAAMRGLADRVSLQGVQALVNTLVQTEKYGTPLAQALRVLSAEMRDDRMMRAEEKAARLPAILTVPMIVFILPPLFIILIGPAIIKAMDVVKGMKSGAS